MVEAAGVEPASERPVATGIYVRIRSFVFATGLKKRQDRQSLARINLAPPHQADDGASLLK